MKKSAEEPVYKHPVHSLILDPNDSIWKQYFTTTELHEIRHHRTPKLPIIPNNLQEYLNSYNKNWKSGKELYSFADNQRHDPIEEFDKKVFLYNDKLKLDDSPKHDLLHKGWSFIYRIFKDVQAKSMFGERASGAVALGKNEERDMEAKDRRSRKAVDTKLDILFKIGFNEHDFCKVGKYDVTICDDKYFNDSFIKLPKTLRDMLFLLVQDNPSKVNQLSTIEFLVMGLAIELVVMDIPVGNYITQITKTERFMFSTTIDTIAIDSVPLLELTWKSKEIMKQVHKTLNDRKKNTFCC
ncbi:MAG: hypothetical protein EXX96DRAFT_594822 [Benjaminiella poitrasii]|nr:MAG: hypothetical protein EXX96DRAFT_594822 [Benjaminiella poitrasii]